MVEKITNHEDLAIEKIIWILRYGRESIPAIVQIHASYVQELEDLFFSMFTELNFVTTTNDYILNKLGKENFQFERVPGLSTEQYRSLLFAKVAEYLSQGTNEDVLNILNLIGASNILYKRYQPATIKATFDDSNELLSISSILGVIMRATPPIGVEINRRTNSGLPFGFAGNSNAAGFDIGKLGESANNG